eukprot:jgi/Mesvir1/11174/Mv16994-RA.1
MQPQAIVINQGQQGYYITERYCGLVSWLLCIFCGIPVCCCPCDTRQVWVSTGGGTTMTMVSSPTSVPSNVVVPAPQQQYYNAPPQQYMGAPPPQQYPGQQPMQPMYYPQQPQPAMGMPYPGPPMQHK